MGIQSASDVEAAYLDWKHEPAFVVTSHVSDRLSADLSRDRGVPEVHHHLSETALAGEGGIWPEPERCYSRNLLRVFPAGCSLPHVDELHPPGCTGRDGRVVPVCRHCSRVDPAGLGS